MKLTAYSILALSAAALSAPLAQAEGNFAIGAGVGTDGGSIEGQYKINDYLQIRGEAHVLSFDQDVSADDIDYNGDLDFSGGGAFIEFHPFQNSFYLTAGAFAGTKEIGVDIKPGQNITINGVVYTPSEYGDISGNVEFDDIAPFLGLGYDNTFTGDGRWGVNFLAGIAMFGSGDVGLTAQGGTLSNSQDVQEEVERQRKEIEDDIEDFDMYPIVKVGLTYRFN